jgi:Ankyrin repeats (many copies)
MSSLLSAIVARDLPALKSALRTARQAVPGRAMVDAARLGWQAGFAALQMAGGDPNAIYRNYRPLHALLQEKPHEGGSSTPARVAMLTWMLANGADPELTAAWPAARALVIAAFSGETTYVRALIDAGAVVDIFTAAALGSHRKVAGFLKRDASLAMARDALRLTALQCCAGSRLGRAGPKTALALLETARVLVDAGADVNAETKSWAHDVAVSYFVIRSGQVEMLKFLLGRGIDATRAISAAAWENREDLVDLLIAHGADINQAYDHTTPVLNELIRWGQFQPARMILAKGMSPNLPDERGWTAVHQAVSRGHVKMLADLIAAGGDATIKDAQQWTPVDMARLAGRKDLMAALNRHAKA